MLPGKKYTPEDLLHVVRRRAWLIAVPFALVSAAGSVYIHSMPDRFRATATILVVPQQVSEKLVNRTINQRVDERVNAMKQQVLSRNQLEPLIKQYNLYGDQVRAGMMQDAVERMRTRDITPKVAGDVLTLSFMAPSPRIAKEITDVLAARFISESVRDRDSLATTTTQFFDAALEDARRRLLEKEQQLRDYQQRYSGGLPSQSQSNLAALNDTRGEIRQALETNHLDAQRKTQFERELQDLESQPSLDAVVPAVAGGPAGRARTTVEELAQAKKDLAQLQLLYNPTFPSVKVQQRLVNDLQARLEQEQLARPVSAEAMSLPPAERQRVKKITDIKDTLKQIDLNVAARLGQVKALELRASQLQARLDAVPAREAELISLTRDYDTIKGSYKELLGKKEDSALAASLEAREMGEQFKLVDPARTPDRPTSPNRPLLTMISVVLGLGMGVGLVALLEYRDRSFKTDEELTRLLDLPVLAVVPFMQSDEEKHRAWRRRAVVSLGLGATVVACLAVVAYTLVR
jgi:polysaccharide chain length determinant protein (PEP-CTERM system associated)